MLVDIAILLLILVGSGLAVTGNLGPPTRNLDGTPIVLGEPRPGDDWYDWEIQQEIDLLGGPGCTRAR